MKAETSFWLLIIVLGLLLTLPGCSRVVDAAETQKQVAEASVHNKLVTFIAAVDVSSGGNVFVDLGVHNRGESLPEDRAFSGSWQLIGPGYRLYAGGSLQPLPALARDEKTVLLTWRGELAPGTYELHWGAPAYGATLMAFDVVQDGGRLNISNQYIADTASFAPPP